MAQTHPRVIISSPKDTQPSKLLKMLSTVARQWMVEVDGGNGPNIEIGIDLPLVIIIISLIRQNMLQSSVLSHLTCSHLEMTQSQVQSQLGLRQAVAVGTQPPVPTLEGAFRSAPVAPHGLQIHMDILLGVQ